MEIVINIPEEYRDYIKRNYNFKNKDDYNAVVIAIANGTPLPKGHGRLVDVKDFNLATMHYVVGEVICTAPTIIEADKENKE